MTAKVLIIDDDINLLASLRRQLRDDFQVTTVAGGSEALDYLEKEGPFSVVVSDMRMPAMNGLRLLQEFKARAPDTVRIMLTGCTDQNTATQAINEGSVFRFQF